MGKRNHGSRAKDFTRGYLADIGADVCDAVKAELAIGANKIVKDAKQNCPVGRVDTRNSARPGALRDSIKAVGNKKGSIYKLTADAKNPTTGIPYGQFVEFWPERKRPFLYPAFDANYQEIRAACIAAMRGAIKKHAIK